jgi:formylmethanofuran dehydrogenase subunit E
MTVKAGEEALHTGDLRCTKCGELVHVEEGVTIPRCAVCNGGDFTRRNRPIGHPGEEV